jgi:FkbM family methyltransferase
MKIYVDCGAYKGVILNHFRNNPLYGRDYLCYAIECNPSLYHVSYGPGVIPIHKAAWISKGEISFYRDPKCFNSQGNSVFKEKTTGHLDREHPVIVQCFDFSEWLKSTIKPDDYLVIKMNIEGAEYPVLNKLIVDETINLINELHIQFHWKKIRMDEHEHRLLVNKLSKIQGLKLYSGYGRIRQAKKK